METLDLLTYGDRLGSRIETTDDGTPLAIFDAGSEAEGVVTAVRVPMWLVFDLLGRFVREHAPEHDGTATIGGGARQATA